MVGAGLEGAPGRMQGPSGPPWVFLWAYSAGVSWLWPSRGEVDEAGGLEGPVECLRPCSPGDHLCLHVWSAGDPGRR